MKKLLLAPLFLSAFLFSCSSGSSESEAAEGGETASCAAEESGDAAAGSYYFKYTLAGESTAISMNDVGFSIDNITGENSTMFGTPADLKARVVIGEIATPIKEATDLKELEGQSFPLSFKDGSGTVYSGATFTLENISDGGDENEYLGKKYNLSGTFTGPVYDADSNEVSLSDGSFATYIYKKSE